MARAPELRSLIVQPGGCYLDVKMNADEQEVPGTTLAGDAVDGAADAEASRAVDAACAGDDGDADAALRLFVVLTRAQRALAEHARRSVEGHGLGTSEFAVLALLYHKGRLPLGEVGSRVLLTSGSVTYVTDKLEQRGMLQRVACPSDRRVTWAELTAAGRALMDRVFPDHREAMRVASSGLTREEKQIAAALVRRLGLKARDLL